MTAPDAIGPVLGMRIWHVDAQRWFTGRWGSHGRVNTNFGGLRPLNWPRNSVAWPGWKALHAECRAEEPKRHRSPAAGCRCGIYASKRIDEVREPLLFALAHEFWRYARRNPHDGGCFWLVAGTVALWGRVIEGTKGYRAEYAYPQELWLLPPAVFGDVDLGRQVQVATDLMPALRSRYGVPVGYVGNTAEWNDLLMRPNLGQFFGWRFHRGGRDEFGRMLGDAGRATDRLPAVGDALELLFASTRWSERTHARLIAETYLAPVLGDVPLRALGRQHFARYRAQPPRRAASGRPYSERTIRRHLAILRAAAHDAAQRGWFVPADIRTAG